MSDFLTRLVDRSRGLRPTMQPRLPSIPDPTPETISEDIVSEPPREENAVAQPIEIFSPSRQTALQPDAIERTIALSSGEAPREPLAARAYATPEVRPADTIGIQPLITAANEPRPVESKSALLPRSTRVTHARHEGSGSNFRVTDKAASQLALPAIRPRSQVSPHPTEPSTTEKKDSSVAPTIRVTIGRIDVRAVFAPAQPKPRVVASSPALSLDDYLNSRQRKGKS